MDAHPLEAARIKIGRAEEHIRELDREAGAFVSAVCRGPVPARLSAIVGDALSNMRASLDLTFWTLSLETGPKDPDRERLFFPIFANEAKFRSALPGFSRYISAEAAAAVERVQPFRTHNVALAILRTLSNKDKHGFVGLGIRSKADAAPFISFGDAALPVGPAVAVLSKIARHIGADVLPQFEALLVS